MKFDLKRIVKNYVSKKKWYSIVSDIVFIVLVVLLIIPSTRTDVASLFIKVTSFAPSELDEDEQFVVSDQTKDWVVYNVSGEPFSFSDLNEKPVFLNFWATWCPPCIAELPGIQDLYHKYGDKVNFVIVSNETRAEVRAFAKERDYTDLPFYQNKNVPYDFYSQSIPTTFVIDKNGKVVLSKKGVAKWNSGKIEDLLDELIENR